MKHQSDTPTFSNAKLNDWFARGSLKNLVSRLGTNQVFCIDEGDSDQEVVLLIHGFPTSTYDWLPIWEAIGSKYRLVCLDMLGFGFSDKPDNRDYSIHQQADLFESLISKLGISEYHVLAHDYGVSVAQELLARQIDGTGQGQWKSCTLLNGGLFPETHRALLIQKLMLSPIGKWVNKLTGFSAFSASFSKVFGESSQPSTQELREFWEAINYNNGRHVFHNLITYINDRITHRERWLNALVNSPVPMALINGSVDPVSGAHLVTRYKELNCRLDYLKELPNVGHYPQVESPDDVSNAFLEFIATQR